MLTVADALDESELRSFRRVIFDLFGGPESNPPGPPILLRRDSRVGRPFWRIDASPTMTITREASGWENTDRPYAIGYYGASQDDALEKINKLRAVISRHDVPFRFYGAGWFRPAVRLVPNPAGLPPGIYNVSASVVSAAGEETMASEAVRVPVTEPSYIEALVRSWPWQSPLDAVARVYLSGPTGPRRLALTAPERLPVRGSTSLLLTALPPSSASVEPTVSTVRCGYLHVLSVTRNVYESPDNDGEFDAVLSVTVSRQLHIEPQGGLTVYGPDGVTVSDIGITP